MTGIAIRPARADEGEQLRPVMHDAKTHWEADPNAVGFYERMGAAVVGETESTWERSIPVMQPEVAP